MARRSRIIFTNNEQSDRGIMSVILGVICICSLLYSCIYSYLKEGEVVEHRFGAALILTLFFAIAGLILAALGRNAADRYKLIPTIGIVLNSAVILALAFILWIGLFLRSVDGRTQEQGTSDRSKLSFGKRRFFG